LKLGEIMSLIWTSNTLFANVSQNHTSCMVTWCDGVYVW